tara:strand:- start:494 stop:778 length:285 start_codon:yes stop_codon:yes gene_type:complete
MNSSYIQRGQAINSLKPGASWSDRNGVLEWDASNSQSKPTEDEITAEIKRLEYSHKRAAEYPSLEEQLDYIYHNGLTKWKTEIIQPVKEKYPKS